MKTRAMLSVLALAALAACGGGDEEGQTSGGVDTTGTAATMPMADSTATMAPPMAPMTTDTTGMSGGMAPGSPGTAGAGQSDTLIKTDSTHKM
ncbi:MAG TPA: hypothetical protein VGB15_09145 [Longimicrobium sp.]|jgi:hypothetical protein